VSSGNSKSTVESSKIWTPTLETMEVRKRSLPYDLPIEWMNLFLTDACIATDECVTDTRGW
jgi:hypothetical protein